MATFQPDDLKDIPLRKLAAELGVPVADRLRPDVQQDIEQKHPNVLLISSVLYSAPVPPAPQSRSRDTWGIVALAATALTAIFTFFAALASWRSANAANAVVAQTFADKEDDKKRSWQTHKVYEIIDDAGKEAPDFKGLSFEAIMTNYRSAAQEPEVAIKIGKDELSPFYLRKILTELQSSQLIYKTWENQYIAQRIGTNTRADNLRTQTIGKAVLEILRTLKDKSGQLTYQDLEKEIKRQFKGLADDDYLFAMYQLAAQNMITIDDKQRVWASLHPPPPK
jgi:hypothetical protein